MSVRTIYFYSFFIFFYIIGTFSVFCKKNKKKKAQFNKEANLTFNSERYKYSRTISFGFLFGGSRGLFTKLNSTLGPSSSLDYDHRRIDNKFLFMIGGINFSYNVLFSSPFFASALGVFPRFGINLGILGQNYITRFWLYFFQNVGIMFNNAAYRFMQLLIKSRKLFRCIPEGAEPCMDRKEYYKSFMKLPSGIVNIPFTFEPEIGVFETVKVVPQIGIGPSLVFLSKNCLNDYFPSDPESFNKENDELYYKYVFDISLTVKFIFKFTSSNGFNNAFHLELGYTYNPLLLDRLDDDGFAVTKDGLWSVFLSLNYARNIDIGLETPEFLNPDVKTSLSLSDMNVYSSKEKIDKSNMYFDVGLGFCLWHDLSSTGDIDSAPCPIIGFSFSMPYLGVKLSDYHYLSFIGVDINEDLWTGQYHNKDHNFFWSMVNNLYVTYNFLNLMSDYKGVKFVHKLGVYVPFLTNLMSYLDKPSKSYAFSREKIGLENRSLYDSLNDNWLSVLYGRLSYKFKMYIDIFRLAGSNIKCKPFFNSYFYFGINTTLFNRRIDYSSVNSKFEFDIIRFDSISFGISFRVN